MEVSELNDTLMALAVAAAETNVRTANKGAEWVRREVGDPKWEEGQKVKVHDWRNHVPKDLRRLWSELPLSARLALFVVACDGANAEDWGAY